MTSAPTTRTPPAPCWYFITLSQCVLCARTTETRERRYDARPDDWGERHEYLEAACQDHFL